MNILNQLYFLTISHLPASTVATISGALESAFNDNVKPEIKAVGNIVIGIGAAIILIQLIRKIIFAWQDYKHEREINWQVLVALLICLVLAITAPTWMWGIIGW